MRCAKDKNVYSERLKTIDFPVLQKAAVRYAQETTEGGIHPDYSGADFLD
jgi:hypothetical protein